MLILFFAKIPTLLLYNSFDCVWFIPNETPLPSKFLWVYRMLKSLLRTLRRMVAYVWNVFVHCFAFRSSYVHIHTYEERAHHVKKSMFSRVLMSFVLQNWYRGPERHSEHQDQRWETYYPWGEEIHRDGCEQHHSSSFRVAGLWLPHALLRCRT